MRKLYLILLVFLITNINAREVNIPNISNLNLESVSGNKDLVVNERKDNIRLYIKDNLNVYYQNDDVINNMQKEVIVNETNWTIISDLFDCGSWTDIGGGQEERICKVKKSRIVSEKDRNVLNTTLNRMEIEYEEIEEEIIQIRNAGPSVPVIPSPPPSSIPEYIDGITVTIDTVSEIGLGQSFDFNWDSTNAVQCSVPQNGVQLGQGSVQVTLLTLGSNNLTVSCTDGISTRSATVSVNVVSIPLELEILTPTVNQRFNFQENYILSYRSLGANECSIDGGASNASNVNRDLTMTGSGVTTTHTIVCSNGTDSISRSVTILGRLPPPENGACGWGYSNDLRIGWNINFHAPNQFVNGIETLVSVRQPPNPAINHGQSITFTMDSNDLCGWSNCRNPISGNRCDFGGTLIWSTGLNRYQCCNRVSGRFRVTLSCNNGVLMATRNSSTCDINGPTYSFLVQNFNQRAVRYISGMRNGSGAYNYTSTVIWTNPN